RGQHHRELPRVDVAAAALDAGQVVQLHGDAVEKVEALLRTAQLPAAIAHRYLHLLPLLEEAAGVPELHVEVVDVSAGAELELLHLHRVPALACLTRRLLLLVLVLAPVHDTADRGASGGGDFDEVQPVLAGTLSGGFDGKDSELFAVGADYSDRGEADLVVDS